MAYAQTRNSGFGFSGREMARAREFTAIWSNELHAVFRDIAPNYDRASNVASLGLYNRWLAQFIAFVDVEPDLDVLDVCAGTNAIGLGLLRKQPAIRVNALDRSAAMQTVGRRIAQSLGFRIDSTIGDAHCLPFPDASFDVVTLGWASRHLRVVEVFSEVRRVLKPGGRFYHCDMLRPKSRTVEELYCLYLKVCVSMTALLFRSSPEARSCRDYFVRAIHSFYTADEISELLAEVGFINVSCLAAPGGVVAFHGATGA